MALREPWPAHLFGIELALQQQKAAPTAARGKARMYLQRALESLSPSTPPSAESFLMWLSSAGSFYACGSRIVYNAPDSAESGQRIVPSHPRADGLECWCVSHDNRALCVIERRADNGDCDASIYLCPREVSRSGGGRSRSTGPTSTGWQFALLKRVRVTTGRGARVWAATFSSDGRSRFLVVHCEGGGNALVAESARQPGHTADRADEAGGGGARGSGGGSAEESLPARLLAFDWAQARLLCTERAAAAGGYLKTSGAEEEESTGRAGVGPLGASLSSTGTSTKRSTRSRRSSGTFGGSMTPGDRAGLAATGKGAQLTHSSNKSYARLGTRGLRLCFNPMDATQLCLSWAEYQLPELPKQEEGEEAAGQPEATSSGARAPGRVPPLLSRAPPTIGEDGGGHQQVDAATTGSSTSGTTSAVGAGPGLRDTVVTEVGGGVRMFRLLLPSATAELAPGTKIADPKHWASGGGRGALVPQDWTSIDSTGSGQSAPKLASNTRTPSIRRYPAFSGVGDRRRVVDWCWLPDHRLALLVEDEEEFGERAAPSTARSGGMEGLPALESEEQAALKKAERAARAPLRDWIRRQRVLVVADGGVVQELWVDWHALAVMRAGQGNSSEQSAAIAGTSALSSSSSGPGQDSSEPIPRLLCICRHALGFAVGGEGGLLMVYSSQTALQVRSVGRPIEPSGSGGLGRGVRQRPFYLVRALRLPVPLADQQNATDDDDAGVVEGASAEIGDAEAPSSGSADGAHVVSASLTQSEAAMAQSRPAACLVGMEPTSAGESILIVTGDPWAAADAAAASGIGPGPGPGRLLGRVQNRAVRQAGQRMSSDDAIRRLRRAMGEGEEDEDGDNSGTEAEDDEEEKEERDRAAAAAEAMAAEASSKQQQKGRGMYMSRLGKQRMALARSMALAGARQVAFLAGGSSLGGACLWDTEQLTRLLEREATEADISRDEKLEGGSRGEMPFGESITPPSTPVLRRRDGGPADDSSSSFLAAESVADRSASRGVSASSRRTQSPPRPKKRKPRPPSRELATPTDLTGNPGSVAAPVSAEANWIVSASHVGGTRTLQVAASRPLAVSVGRRDACVVVWDLAARCPIATRGYPRSTAPVSAALHPSGQWMAVARRNAGAEALWVADGSRTLVNAGQLVGTGARSAELKFSSRGGMLAVGCDSCVAVFACHSNPSSLPTSTGGQFGQQGSSKAGCSGLCVPIARLIGGKGPARWLSWTHADTRLVCAWKGGRVSEFLVSTMGGLHVQQSAITAMQIHRAASGADSAEQGATGGGVEAVLQLLAKHEKGAKGKKLQPEDALLLLPSRSRANVLPPVVSPSAELPVPTGAGTLRHLCWLPHAPGRTDTEVAALNALADAVNNAASEIALREAEQIAVQAGNPDVAANLRMAFQFAKAANKRESGGTASSPLRSAASGSGGGTKGRKGRRASLMQVVDTQTGKTFDVEPCWGALDGRLVGMRRRARAKRNRWGGAGSGREERRLSTIGAGTEAERAAAVQATRLVDMWASKGEMPGGAMALVAASSGGGRGSRGGRTVVGAQPLANTPFSPPTIAGTIEPGAATSSSLGSGRKIWKRPKPGGGGGAPQTGNALVSTGGARGKGKKSKRKRGRRGSLAEGTGASALEAARVASHAAKGAEQRIQAQGHVPDGDEEGEADEMEGLKLIHLHDVPRESHPSELLNLFGKRIGAEGHVSAAPMPHSVCAIVAARAPVSERALKQALGAAVAEVESKIKREVKSDEGIGERAQIGAVPFGGGAMAVARTLAAPAVQAPSQTYSPDAETLVAMRNAAKHAADMRAEAAVEAQYDLQTAIFGGTDDGCIGVVRPPPPPPVARKLRQQAKIDRTKEQDSIRARFRDAMGSRGKRISIEGGDEPPARTSKRRGSVGGGASVLRRRNSGISSKGVTIQASPGGSPMRLGRRGSASSIASMESMGSATGGAGGKGRSRRRRRSSAVRWNQVKGAVAFGALQDDDDDRDANQQHSPLFLLTPLGAGARWVPMHRGPVARLATTSDSCVVMSAGRSDGCISVMVNPWIVQQAASSDRAMPDMPHSLVCLPKKGSVDPAFPRDAPTPQPDATVVGKSIPAILPAARASSLWQRRQAAVTSLLTGGISSFQRDDALALVAGGSGRDGGANAPGSSSNSITLVAANDWRMARDTIVGLQIQLSDVKRACEDQLSEQARRHEQVASQLRGDSAGELGSLRLLLSTERAESGEMESKHRKQQAEAENRHRQWKERAEMEFGRRLQEAREEAKRWREKYEDAITDAELRQAKEKDEQHKTEELVSRKFASALAEERRKTEESNRYIELMQEEYEGRREEEEQTADAEVITLRQRAAAAEASQRRVQIESRVKMTALRSEVEQLQQAVNSSQEDLAAEQKRRQEAEAREHVLHQRLRDFRSEQGEQLAQAALHLKDLMGERRRAGALERSRDLLKNELEAVKEEFRPALAEREEAVRQLAAVSDEVNAAKERELAANRKAEAAERRTRAIRTEMEGIKQKLVLAEGRLKQAAGALEMAVREAFSSESDKAAAGSAPSAAGLPSRGSKGGKRSHMASSPKRAVASTSSTVWKDALVGVYKQLALGELPRSVTSTIAGGVRGRPQSAAAGRRGSSLQQRGGLNPDSTAAAGQPGDSAQSKKTDALTDRDKLGLRTAVARAKVQAEKLIRKHGVGRPTSAARTSQRPKLSDSAGVIDAAARSPGKLLPGAPLRQYAPGASRAARASRSKAKEAGQMAKTGKADVRAVLAALQPTVHDAVSGAEDYDEENSRLNVLAGAEAQDLPPGAVTEVRRQQKALQAALGQARQERVRDADKSRAKSVRLQSENYVLVSEINNLRRENALIKKSLHKAQADAAVAKSGQRMSERQLKEMSEHAYQASQALGEGTTASVRDGAGYSHGQHTLGGEGTMRGTSVASLHAASLAESKHARPQHRSSGTLKQHGTLGYPLSQSSKLSPVRSKPFLGRSGLGQSPPPPASIAPPLDPTEDEGKRNPMTPDTDRSSLGFKSSLAQETTARAIAAARKASQERILQMQRRADVSSSARPPGGGTSTAGHSRPTTSEAAKRRATRKGKRLLGKSKSAARMPLSSAKSVVDIRRARRAGNPLGGRALGSAAAQTASSTALPKLGGTLPPRPTSKGSTRQGWGLPAPGSDRSSRGSDAHDGGSHAGLGWTAPEGGMHESKRSILELAGSASGEGR